MATIEEIKIHFDNFLKTRVYYKYTAKNKSKAIGRDIGKYKYYYNILDAIDKFKKKIIYKY